MKDEIQLRKEMWGVRACSTDNFLSLSFGHSLLIMPTPDLCRTWGKGANKSLTAIDLPSSLLIASSALPQERPDMQARGSHGVQLQMPSSPLGYPLIKGWEKSSWVHLLEGRREEPWAGCGNQLGTFEARIWTSGI